MAHARKQIRDAITARLTGLATSGTRVHASRVFPLQDGFSPTILIYTLEEQSQVSSMGRPQTLRRQTTVAVDCAAQAKAGVDDTLDQMAAEIETAIGGDETLDGLVLDITLLRTSVGLTAEGKTPSGRMRLDFAVTYETKSNAPETII